MAIGTAPIWRQKNDHTVRFRAELNAEGTHYNVRRLDKARQDGKVRKARWESLCELES